MYRAPPTTRLYLQALLRRLADTERFRAVDFGRPFEADEPKGWSSQLQKLTYFDDFHGESCHSGEPTCWHDLSIPSRPHKVMRQ